MNIRIDRTLCSIKGTHGTISVDGMPLGKVVEPVTIDNAEPGEICAIRDGTYEVKVVINPKSGTPTIKIYGNDLPHNLAIRARRPFSAMNASPSFWNEDNNEEQNIRRWSELLSMLMDSQEHHTLIISPPKHSPPSPPKWGDVLNSTRLG